MNACPDESDLYGAAQATSHPGRYFHIHQLLGQLVCRIRCNGRSFSRFDHARDVRYLVFLAQGQLADPLLPRDEIGMETHLTSAKQ